MSKKVYHAYPLGKNKIMVRLENTADKFDDPSAKVTFIDLLKFAQNFYLEANPGMEKVPDINIRELTLSGNEMSQMKDKYRW